MAKKRVGKFPKVFRQMAVDRVNHCENIVELARTRHQSTAVVCVGHWTAVGHRRLARSTSFGCSTPTSTSQLSSDQSVLRHMHCLSFFFRCLLPRAKLVRSRQAVELNP